MSHQNLGAMTQTLLLVAKPTLDDVYLSYLPMAHVMEKAIICACLTSGLVICLFSGDVGKLKDDLTIFRPTLFVSVPRLYSRFYDGNLANVNKAGRMQQFMFNRAIGYKKFHLQQTVSYNSNVYDKLVFNKLKDMMGGRVRLMVSGSAPISPEVLDFLKICFCAPLLEGYGQTEGSCLEFVTREDDPMSGHVGGPGACNEFKLVDIPDMNYTANDRDEHGKPTPRGEIYVRGPNVISGYYKLDDKNKEAFTDDGWIRSGDVGMLFSDKNRLKIIDRKKNIFKLAQGEYIAPEKLENAYKQAHPAISAIYVYGNSLKSCLVGVVNVEAKNLVKLSAEFGVQGEDAEQLAKDPNVKKGIIGLIDKIAKEKNFNSLERLKDVYIETKPFHDLGLLTEAFKVKRPDTEKLFKDKFEEMYKKLN